MLNRHCIFKSLTTTSHSQPISAALGLMCVLSIANWTSSIAGTIPKSDSSALDALASPGGMIQVKVRLAGAESVTSETAWIDAQGLGDPGFGEPDPIIVGTALIALYETGPGNLGLFGEPDPIIVGTGSIAFYAQGLGNPGPFGEPDPIIVGNLVVTLNEQERDRSAVGEMEGMALFAPADEQGGAVVVSGKQYGIRFLSRLGSFWVGRDSLTIVVSD